jgi:cation:H+ antiporter
MEVLPYFIFIIGLIFLVKGADWLISGASSLGRRLGISDLAIGMTVVAFGTSLPEFIVSILAAASGHADIAVNNVIGSNIFNILFILGLAAGLVRLSVTKGTVWKEIPFSLLAVLMLSALSNDQILDHAKASQLSRIDGLVLLGFFLIFLYYIAGIARENRMGGFPVTGIPSQSVGRALIRAAVGLAMLLAGGRWTVDGAVYIAQKLGVSQSLIGLTIVSAGTSLPELAASVTAAFRKNYDIAVGNVVGSNIFNIFLILGVSATIKPLPLNAQSNTDLGVLVGSTLVLFLCMFTGKRRIIDRWEGVLMIFGYIGYIAFLIARE